MQEKQEQVHLSLQSVSEIGIDILGMSGHAEINIDKARLIRGKVSLEHLINALEELNPDLGQHCRQFFSEQG